MRIKEPKTFYDSIRPLVYFNLLSGMGYYHEPSDRNSTKYLFMKIQSVVVILVNWAAMIIGMFSVNEFLRFENASPLVLMMYKTLVYTNAFISICSPFLVWLRRKGTGDCLRQIPKLNETFETILGVRNDYKKAYILLGCEIIAINCVMIFVVICDTVWSLEVELRIDDIRSLLKFFGVAATLHQPILVMLLLDLNFCCLLKYLETKFRDLNECLLGLVEKPFTSGLGIVTRKFVRTRTFDKIKNNEDAVFVNEKNYLVHEVRKLHLELCKLSRKINRVFGIQNLLSMGISFVMITGLLYTIYGGLSLGNFTSEKLKEIIPSSTWTAIYVVKIWMVNYWCWVVSNESKKTGEIIYELLKPRVDRELQREIQEFAVQMLQNPVRFNACGFFTLDYTFIQGVVGSITTYLVIIIQMSQVSQPLSSNPLVNVTRI